MGDLSTHFNWSDVTKSATAEREKIDNTLPDDLRDPVISQAMLLEGVRQALNDWVRLKYGPNVGEVKLVVSSWFRCKRLNRAVGSSDRSAHLRGVATDCHPVGIPIDIAFQVIKAAGVMRDIDQLIIEHDKQGHTWLHIAQHPEGKAPRDQAFALEKKEATREQVS